MRVILTIAILSAALVACSAGAPAETPLPGSTIPIAVGVEHQPGVARLTATVATATPEPTATPRSAPTVARPSANAGICYRTPELQRWVIQRLGIPSCRLITEPELYRITDGLDIPAVLKPGDLDGLANVPAVVINGYCQDWTDAAVAAAMLEGLNPEASIGIESDLPFIGERSQMQLMGYVIYPDGEGNTWDAAEILVNANNYFGIKVTEAQAEGWHKRAVALKQTINRRAHAIATAIGEARTGEAGLVRLKSQGVAVIGAEGEPGAVVVTVGLRLAQAMPDCEEEGRDAM